MVVVDEGRDDGTFHRNAADAELGAFDSGVDDVSGVVDSCGEVPEILVVVGDTAGGDLPFKYALFAEREVYF